MSSEGAERSFDRIGQKADEMSRKVTQTSAQAGQAVDQIGTGANRSADEFTRAEGRIVSSIKRATTELQNLGKTASQRLELRIDTQGLDRAKFEPLLANLRELEAAQNRVAGSGRSFAGGLQNTSYQLQDFIVQVNGGTDATRALAMQLPQMLIGFGALGAGIGVVAALLPNIVALFGDSANEAESLKDAMSGMDDAISQVGRTVRSFDMEGLYEEFNAASAATRAATIEQLNFQRTFIETQRLVSQKAFSESLSGIGDFGFLDKLSGGGTAASRVADDLGVTLDVAERLAPVLKGLRDGTEDVGSAFTRFGTQLLSGNKEAVALATAMRDLANGEKDAYAASSALSEALDRMAKGHVRTKKETEEAAKASKAYADETQRMAEAARDLVTSLLGQSSGLTSDFFKKWETLGQAYKAGAISLQDLTDAQAALLAQQPAMKQAAKDAEDYGKALASTVGALEDRALVLETELKNYGLTKSQIERTTAARLEEVRAMARANGATEDYLANLDREITARKRIAEATAGAEAAEANRKAADDAAKEWQRTADAIEDALIDALMEGGKSGKEYIEGLFRSMVLRPIVQAIVQPIAGGITNAMGIGAPGAGGGGSSGGGLGGINPLSFFGGNSIGNAYGSVFGSLGSSSMLSGTSAGNYLTGVSGNAGSYSNLAYAGAGIAGGFAGDLLFNGKGYSGTGGSLGAQIGMAAGGPIGAVVGTVLGSALGSFIGGGKPSDKTSWATYDPATGRATDIGSMTGKKDPGQEQRDATAVLASLVGGFAGIAGISSSITAMIGGRDGTRLRINRDEGTQGFLTPQAGLANGGNSLNYGNGDDAIKRMLDDLVDEGTLPQATIDAWRSIKTDMMGAARDATELVSTLNLLVAGYDTATIERANLLQMEGEALEAALARMQSLESALSGTALPGDALAQSVGAIIRQFDELAQAVPLSVESLGSVIDGLDLTTAEGRKTYQSLMALAPAFVEIQAAQRALYDQLYTDEQRASNLAVEVGDAFAQLGLTLPATRDEMRALIDAQDGTTEAGAKLKAQLLGLVPAFVSVSDAAQQAAIAATQNAQARVDSATSAVAAAESALRAAYQRESGELRNTISQLENFTRSIRDLKRELIGGDLSPLGLFGRRDELSRQFADVAARAASGDEQAIGELSGLTSQYLGVVQESASSAEDYYRKFAAVSRTLDDTQSLAERELDATRSQLEALDRQVSALITLNDSALSVRDAIIELQGALSVQQKAQVQQQVQQQVAGYVGTQVAAASGYAASGGVLDASAATPTTARETQIAALYSSTLGRAADAGGLSYWANSSLSLSDIASNIAASSEAAARAISKEAQNQFLEDVNKALGLSNTIKAFASGGYHAGGLRLVGEQGPELEVTGPARIYSADQTRAMLGGSNEDMVRELRALRAELAELKAASAATARSTSDTARILARTTNGGNAMLVETTA